MGLQLATMREEEGWLDGRWSEHLNPDQVPLSGRARSKKKW